MTVSINITQHNVMLSVAFLLLCWVSLCWMSHLLFVMLSTVALSFKCWVLLCYCYSDYRYAHCHDFYYYAGYCYANCHIFNCYAECSYAHCHILIVILSASMPNVVMVSVMAPFGPLFKMPATENSKSQHTIKNFQLWILILKYD